MNKEQLLLSIVVPAYNEQARAKGLAVYFESNMQQVPFNWELIIVDDGSHEHLKSMLLEQPYFNELFIKGLLQIHRHETNRGKGAAIETGVKYSKGKYVLTMDADLSTFPDEAFPWLTKLEHSTDQQVLIGSREHKNSVVLDDVSRRITGRVFNFLIRIFLPIKIKDTQCGFKLYPSNLAKEVIMNLHEKGWAHDLEIILKLHYRKISVIEMPIKWKVSGESKISIVRDSIKMFLSLLSLSYMNITGKLK